MNGGCFFGKLTMIPAVSAAIGCAGPPATRLHEAARPETTGARSAPSGRSPASAQSLAEGPPCGPGGPTVELKAMRYRKGRPPHRSVIELSSYSAEDRFLIAFSTFIAIGDQPAESWAGQAGLSPVFGEFTLATLVTELERKVDDMAGEPLDVRIVCVVDGLP